MLFGRICLHVQSDCGKVNDSKGVIRRMKEKFYKAPLMTKSVFFHNYIENGLFIALLAFYPLIHVNQGLDVADATYSLGNFQYFQSADGTWMVATYLANVLGYVMTKFPNGNTLLGMQIYTGSLVSVLAVFFYLMLRRKMSSILAFAGEMLAISLCWCPTVILYNYLTYLLMGIGVWLLYLGCFQVEGSRRQKWHLIVAGVCLGANIAVRMPNIVQAAFILVLWYSAFLRKEAWKEVVRDTLYCLTGYLAGFSVPFAAICMRYGPAAYVQMVQTMFAMTDQAADYKPTSMITLMFDSYRRGLYWLVFAAVCMAALYIAYGFYRIICRKSATGEADGMQRPEQGQAAGDMVKVCAVLFRLLCIGVWCVLIRFYWGRGMFHFQYYSYDGVSIYWWAVLFLMTGIAGALWMIISRKSPAEDKALALIVLLQILLTPLGSNNKLFPIINNLFVVAPYSIWCVYLWFGKADAGIYNGSDENLSGRSQRKIVHFPWQSMMCIFGIMFCIQSTGFHWIYVFGDGVWGEVRDTLITEIPKVEGIYTNREKAEYLSDLAVYVRENGLTGKKVILYKEIPGLSYLLDMPCAISSTWPDLESYRLTQFEQDMEAVGVHMDEERPVVIVDSGIAAYYTEDAEACEWFGVNPEEYDADPKIGILRQFIADYDYKETFANMRYVVYE